MSLNQISFGLVAVKSWSSSLLATGNSWFESVVRTRNLRCEIAWIPSDFMTFATVFTEHA